MYLNFYFNIYVYTHCSICLCLSRCNLNFILIIDEWDDKNLVIVKYNN